MFISKKKIKGKDRYYLEHTVRMLNERPKKFSMYLSGYDDSGKPKLLEQHKKKLKKIIEKQKIADAATFYEDKFPFTEEQIRSLEHMKLRYQEIVTALSPTQFQDVLNRFVANFTYETNALEGNSLTLKDVTFLITDNRVAKNRDLREIHETINMHKVMQDLLTKKIRMTHTGITKLHSQVVENTGVSSGYKTLPNALLGRTIQTTPPEQVKLRMEKLMIWFATSQLHPLHKAAIFHGKFEQIHPFDDGNGRVGRLLVNAQLLQSGFPPLIIRKSQRMAYFSALEQFDKGYEEKLERFFLKKFKETFKQFFEVYLISSKIS